MEDWLKMQIKSLKVVTPVQSSTALYGCKMKRNVIETEDSQFSSDVYLYNINGPFKGPNSEFAGMY